VAGQLPTGPFISAGALAKDGETTVEGALRKGAQELPDGSRVGAEELQDGPVSGAQRSHRAPTSGAGGRTRIKQPSREVRLPMASLDAPGK